MNILKRIYYRLKYPGFPKKFVLDMVFSREECSNNIWSWKAQYTIPIKFDEPLIIGRKNEKVKNQIPPL